MCRLLAIIDGDPALRKDALSKFADLADCGAVPPGTPRGHMDGWGIAACKKDGDVVLQKEPASAYGNPKFAAAASAASADEKAPFLIAHLRKASLGKISLENTQPFVSNGYIFAHNGTVKDFQTLEIPADLRAERKGDSDSEVVFLWMIGKMRGAADPAAAFSCACCDLRSRDYTGENIIFADGKTLFALRQANEENTDVARKGLCENYYTLFLGVRGEKAMIVSSERLALDDIVWKEIPNHSRAVINIANGNYDLADIGLRA